jgi:hypothetical protein
LEFHAVGVMACDDQAFLLIERIQTVSDGDRRAMAKQFQGRHFRSPSSGFGDVCLSILGGDCESGQTDRLSIR